MIMQSLMAGGGDVFVLTPVELCQLVRTRHEISVWEEAVV